MASVQAGVNFVIFAAVALLFRPFSTGFLTLVGLAVLFAVSAGLLKRFGRWPLVATWVFAIVLIGSHLPGSFMQGALFITLPVLLYLLAGLTGALFLPTRPLSSAT